MTELSSDASRPAGHLASRHLHHADPGAAALAVAEEEEALRRESQQVKGRRGRFYLAGRLMISALFLTSGFAKVATFSATREALENVGIYASPLLLGLVILVELAGGTMLALGYKARGAAIVLIAALCTITLFVHSDLSNPLNRAFALSNLAFAGGLLLIAAHGAGTFSLDRVSARRSARRSRS